MRNIFVPLKDQSPKDLRWMDEAIKMAQLAIDTGETPVGCVFVDDASNTAIAKGWNKTNELRNATAHAELVALDALFKQHGPGYGCQPKSVTLYVTVEPCIMCASALRQTGVLSRVVYGAGNDRFGGTGGVECIHSDERLAYSELYPSYGGYRREEAVILLRTFYVSENTLAPKPKKKHNRVLKLDVEEIPRSESNE